MEHVYLTGVGLFGLRKVRMRFIQYLRCSTFDCYTVSRIWASFCFDQYSMFSQAIHKALTKGDIGDERSDSELSDEDEIDEKKKN